MPPVWTNQDEIHLLYCGGGRFELGKMDRVDYLFRKTVSGSSRLEVSCCSQEFEEPKVTWPEKLTQHIYNMLQPSRLTFFF